MEPHSIVHLINAVFRHYGLPTPHSPFPLSDFVPNLHQKKKVVLILWDAVGEQNLLDACKADPDIEKLLQPFLHLTLKSVFPTTTTAALTSLCTGLTPIEHGMLGYILFLKRFNSLVNMIDFCPPGLERDILIGNGLNPLKFIPCDTIFQKLHQAGIKPWILTSNQFKDSGLSRMHHHGAAFRGYSDMMEMNTSLRELLVKEKSDSFFMTYWGLTDTYAHRYGPSSNEYQSNIYWLFSMFFREVIGQLSSKNLRETLFFITADHGQRETSYRDEHWFGVHDPLSKMLSVPPAGEPRALYLYPKELSGFRSSFESMYGRYFELYDSADLIREGLFGPPIHIPEEHPDRVGSFTAVAKEGYSLNYKYTGNERTLKGKHGALSHWEMEVPLLILS